MATLATALGKRGRGSDQRQRQLGVVPLDVGGVSGIAIRTNVEDIDASVGKTLEKIVV